LDGFLAHRPAPQLLLTQKIITDIGDFPGSNTRSVENLQLFPKHVEDLKTKVKDVRCGWGHTAVIDENGDLFTFGSNENCQLGLSDKKECFSRPQLVQTLKEIGRVDVVDCGDKHTAAIVKGIVYTWGMGSWGRLGLGKQDDVSIPTPVDLKGEEARVVVCGAYHTLVLTSLNHVFGFGWNKAGRVGVGKQESLTIETPQLVPSLSASTVCVVSIAAGANSSLALDDKGVAYSWGSGAFGNLGHGNETDQWEPRPIDALKDKKVILASVGASHTLALTESGELLTWGQKNDKQMGRQEEKNNLVPVVIPFEGKNVTQLGAAKTHSVLVRDGQLYTWGKGQSGVLGHGSDTNTLVPTLVGPLKDTKIGKVSCSWVHTAVVTEAGAVLTFGSKELGKLGY